jgi:hypothetical protein
MIVYDLDIVGISVAPTKADPPLVIDPNAVLSLSITGQPLQPIAGRSAQVIKAAGIVNLHQLTVCCFDDVIRDAFDEAPLPRSFRGSIPKRLDHWLC